MTIEERAKAAWGHSPLGVEARIADAIRAAVEEFRERAAKLAENSWHGDIPTQQERDNCDATADAIRRMEIE